MPPKVKNPLKSKGLDREGDNYNFLVSGEQGIDVFHREAEKRNICIAIAEKVPSDASEEKFMEVVTNLMKKPNAKAIVLFTRAEDAR